ncbi:bromodomain-containing protein, partial [Cystoisospora suis]
MAVGADYNRGQLPQFFLFSNVLIFPLELLHAEEQIGVDESCYYARTLLAEGIATAWVDTLLHFWCCPDRRKQADSLYLYVGIVKLLVDLFIQANFGLVELKVRRWERLQRYVALVEAGVEEFPLDPLTAYTSSISSSEGGGGGGPLLLSRMPHHSGQQRGSYLSSSSVSSGSASSSSFTTEKDRSRLGSFYQSSSRGEGDGCYNGSPLSSGLVPGVIYLYYSEIFHLKCGIVIHALDRLLASQSLLLHDQFFFNFLIRQYLPLLAKKKEPPSSEKFWRRLLTEVTVQYIYYWNSRPANKAGGKQRLRLKKEKKRKAWGVSALGMAVVEGGGEASRLDGDEREQQELLDVNPQEHDMLKQLEEALISFRSAFVSGTGCPQLNLSFALQLQRKGSSMDFFNFYLDILALQPPASLADPFGIGGAGGGSFLFPNFNRNQLNYPFFASLSSSSALVSSHSSKRSSKTNSPNRKSSSGSSSASHSSGHPHTSLGISNKRGPSNALGGWGATAKQREGGGGGEQHKRPWMIGPYARGDREKQKAIKEGGDRDQGLPSFYLADLAGLAALNLWQAYEISRLRNSSGTDLFMASSPGIGGRGERGRPLSSWEAVICRSLFPTLKLPSSRFLGSGGGRDGEDAGFEGDTLASDETSIIPTLSDLALLSGIERRGEISKSFSRDSHTITTTTTDIYESRRRVDLVREIDKKIGIEGDRGGGQGEEE